MNSFDRFDVTVFLTLGAVILAAVATTIETAKSALAPATIHAGGS